MNLRQLTFLLFLRPLLNHRWAGIPPSVIHQYPAVPFLLVMILTAEIMALFQIGKKERQNKQVTCEGYVELNGETYFISIENETRTNR